MINSLIFKFKTDISYIEVPEELNNPFNNDTENIGLHLSTLQNPINLCRYEGGSFVNE
tara:strand:- start:281 stop:454 length:174 start_codon:yes stop_codon:yes gene_type:complete